MYQLMLRGVWNVTRIRKQRSKPGIQCCLIMRGHGWKGCIYILLGPFLGRSREMNDQFTKWVECIPLPSQSAEETARATVNQFFSRLGCPFQVFTDQGRNFESALFREVCDLLHIHKSRATPYRPSANEQVERCNRTLMEAVRCFIGKNQRTWDQYLPQLAGALKASVNRRTGYTPNVMMLGRLACLRN